VPTV